MKATLLERKQIMVRIVWTRRSRLSSIAELRLTVLFLFLIGLSGRAQTSSQSHIANTTKDHPWENSLAMKFVPVADTQVLFSIWDTRVQDYEAFCRATGRRYEPPDFHQTPTDPAVKVSWFDAVAFCKWLTEKEQNENLIDDRESYRLPTDAEWSIAVGLVNESGPTPEARDGKIRNEFPWGKQWPRPNDAGDYAGASGKRRIATLPVGSFKSNSIGLYDLGGNVWEWCLDTYKGDNSASGRDWGVLRGGSWATSNRLEMQSSYRNVVDRNERDVIYGFRCVLGPKPGGDVKD